MKKTINTDLVQELIRRGLKQPNAWRIINSRKVGQASKILRDVLRELLELKARDKKP